MKPEDLKTTDDLNAEQRRFVNENAIEMFAALFLHPNDNPVDITQSTCACCDERREFLKEVLRRG